MKLLQEKPIHVGLRHYLYDGKRFTDATGKDMQYFGLITDRGNWVEFVEREGFSQNYILFQYAKEEKTDFAYSLCSVEDFEYVEMEQLLDIDELSTFGNYYSCDAAIIKMGIPEIAQHLFYYWIRGGVQNEHIMFPSDNDLYGYFSDKECVLLNYIFRDKREAFTLENFIKKKQQIAKYVDSLNVGRFAESYDRESHIDALMFDYIKEELEYDRKFIYPKLMVWGT